MKLLLNKTIFSLTLLVCITSCSQKDMFEEELYKKVLSIVSDDEKVHEVVHTFNETETEGFISIYCGGTRPIDTDVTITIAKDEEILPEYNRINFDIDETKFAKELKASQYEIPTFTATMKANQEDPYVRIPIKVRPAGLSPDSIYMIPLCISEISAYEVNLDKSSVLYRVLVENDYAEQQNPTYYFMRGTTLPADAPEGTEPTPVVVTKIMYPINKTTSRITVVTNLSEDLEMINKYSILLTVHEASGNVTLAPYKTIEVEQLGDAADNRYEVDEDGLQYFYLNYKYRTLVTPATETDPEVYTQWAYVTETLRREL